jgi:hypothetical protein
LARLASFLVPARSVSSISSLKAGAQKCQFKFTQLADSHVNPTPRLPRQLKKKGYFRFLLCQLKLAGLGLRGVIIPLKFSPLLICQPKLTFAEAGCTVVITRAVTICREMLALNP